MATINMTSIMQKLVVGATNNKSLQNLAYGAALGRITYRKNELLKNFDNHDVTKEIKAGETANSDFLDVGNLFSFIGFYKGEKPTDNIRELLNQQIRLIKAPRGNPKLGRNSVRWFFAVETPFLKDIWAATEYPKGTGNIDRDGSWADDLEKRGIGGFEYYVFSYAFSSDISRSTTGIQKKFKVRSGAFNQPIPYIRALLEDFRKKINI